MHHILQDICGQEAQRRGIPLAIALACERNRGSASPFAPYLRLLPDGVPSLWMKPEQEIADFLGAIGVTSAGMHILWSLTVMPGLTNCFCSF